MIKLKLEFQIKTFDIKATSSILLAQAIRAAESMNLKV